jgi:lantibiotic modifying enzyme
MTSSETPILLRQSTVDRINKLSGKAIELFVSSTFIGLRRILCCTRQTEITDIYFPDVDSHNNGQVTFLVELSQRQWLVYKPTNGTAQKCLNETLQFVAHLVGGYEPPVYPVVCEQRNYSIFEYLHYYDSIQTNREAQRFFSILVL